MTVQKWRVLLMLLPWMAVVHAQNYPSRPVRLVVPAPPGGGTDILGRIVAMKLTDALRQQVIIDNRSGASGMIGSEIVARADPDGHTLLISFTTHVTNPSLFPKMSYDTVRDFAPVAMVGVIPSVLVLHPSIPSQSVKDFIAYAGERPGKLNYGSAGSGSATHLSTVLFNAMSGTSMVHVPYTVVSTFKDIGIDDLNCDLGLIGWKVESGRLVPESAEVSEIFFPIRFHH